MLYILAVTRKNTNINVHTSKVESILLIDTKISYTYISRVLLVYIYVRAHLSRDMYFYFSSDQ